jgi:transglutaminase-like putative cysteine protease
MSIQRSAPINELLAKAIFLLVPTMFVAFFLLQNTNDYFAIARSNPIQETIYFAGGMGIAALIYAFRFRFLPLFIGLLFIIYSISKGLDSYASGEFDSFFISVQFQVFGALFITGWLIGWGFTRIRYWAILIASVLLCACILLIAKQKTDTVLTLLKAFSPALLYSVYIIFTAEQIYNYKDKSQKFWWFLTRRLFLFTVLVIGILFAVVYGMQKEIKETVDNYGGGGQGGETSMLKKNKDGSFDLKQYSKLSQTLGRSNELLFCAHIDNFFPGTEIPNPLYLTAFYYTKFDTLTETFERDAKIPYNDLFEPDPSALPVFFTKYDSTVIRNSLATKLRRSIDIEVYTKELSPKTYLAPNVGYFVQPVTVEKDFRNEFKAAFRAKGYVSELNSAYFVYNATNPQLKKFQEQRFEVLRKAPNYADMDKTFMSYYTYMPNDVKFKNISDLAHKVTANGKTSVDKVLAIRDWFLSKDENGDPLFKYTDNPGVPDIPSASKLMYFLFENRKGYCAYYAGATLFMLRSLGIPSRIAVGFMTVDRSDKNKGWYWYYADQAHAWVQVYFPGYGWLDFDTTVGNSDAQESPKPDGTPPMQPPRAWLAADGIVEDVDTLHKLMTFKLKNMIFHDKEYNVTKPLDVNMDLKVATIYIDSINVPITGIKKGDEATVVSYADAMKKIDPLPNDNGTTLISRFPKPSPIDEVYLKRKDVGKPEEKPKTTKTEKPVTIESILKTVLLSALILITLLLMLPRIVLYYYRIRYNTAKRNKAYWAYRLSSYYLHMCGIIRGNETPMYYAKNTVDPSIGTKLADFMLIYLKQKYANQQLSATEQQYVEHFIKPFIKQVKNTIRFSARFMGLLNTARMLNYYVKTNE